jgi:hypothetical protein
VALPLNRRNMGRVGRWLALALLVGQFGAEFHVYYSHALADPIDHWGVARNCGTCLASSQLQHAVGTPPPQLPARAIAWVSMEPEASTPAIHRSPYRAYRSRAPPALV